MQENVGAFSCMKTVTFLNICLATDKVTLFFH